jgi:hypothetical protein
MSFLRLFVSPKRAVISGNNGSSAPKRCEKDLNTGPARSEVSARSERAGSRAPKGRGLALRKGGISRPLRVRRRRGRRRRARTAASRCSYTAPTSTPQVPRPGPAAAGARLQSPVAVPCLGGGDACVCVRAVRRHGRRRHTTRTQREADTDARDTGARDTGARDTGARDTGARDTGARDTGARDTGARDTGARDTGARDM